MNRTKIDWCDTRKGASRIKAGRYMLVYCPEHPHAKSKGHVYEHRYLMERWLGRFFQSNEHVHHINGDSADNRIENLMVVSNAEHRQQHWLEHPVPSAKGVEGLQRYAMARRLPRKLIGCACGCGQFVVDRDSKGRQRKYLHGHNQKNRTWKWRARQ